MKLKTVPDSAIVQNTIPPVISPYIQMYIEN